MATLNFGNLAQNDASLKRPRPLRTHMRTCAPPRIIGPGHPRSRRRRALSILASKQMPWAYSLRDTQRTPQLLDLQAKRQAWIPPTPHTLPGAAGVMSNCWSGAPSAAAAAAREMTSPLSPSSGSASGESEAMSSFSASAAGSSSPRSAS